MELEYARFLSTTSRQTYAPLRQDSPCESAQRTNQSLHHSCYQLEHALLLRRSPWPAPLAGPEALRQTCVHSIDRIDPETEVSNVLAHSSKLVAHLCDTSLYSPLEDIVSRPVRVHSVHSDLRFTAVRACGPPPRAFNGGCASRIIASRSIH